MTLVWSLERRKKKNLPFWSFFDHISHLWKLIFLQPLPLCAITEASPRCNSKAFGFHGIGTRTAAAIGANPKVTKAMIATAMPMLDIRTRGKEAVTAMMTAMEAVTVARCKISSISSFPPHSTHGIFQGMCARWCVFRLEKWTVYSFSQCVGHPFLLLGVPDYSQNKGGLACPARANASHLTVYQDHQFLPSISIYQSISSGEVHVGFFTCHIHPYSMVWLQDMQWQVATTARWRAVVAMVEARRVVVNRARRKKSKAWWGEHRGDGRCGWGGLATPLPPKKALHLMVLGGMSFQQSLLYSRWEEIGHV